MPRRATVAGENDMAADWDALAAHIGFDTKEELWLWISSASLFRTAFVDLVDGIKQDGSRDRHMRFPQAKHCARRVKENRSSHAAQKADKSRAEKMCEHYGKFLHKVVEDNTRLRRGIFYKKDLSLVTKQKKIWAVVEQCRDDLTKPTKGKCGQLLDLADHDTPALYEEWYFRLYDDWAADVKVMDEEAAEREAAAEGKGSGA